MDYTDYSSVDENRAKRRKTTGTLDVVPIMPSVNAERDKLVSVLESYGYSGQDAIAFLNGPRSAWVLQSRRFNQMLIEFGQEVSYNLFDVDHHIRCASSILTVDSFKLVFGQKNQGKSQLLHFIYKLLQHCGALVVYLEPRIVMGNCKVDTERISRWWNVLYERLGKPEEFKQFMVCPTVENLQAGLWLLYDVYSKSNPVWVIVDEVTEFTREHPLFVFLPCDEQGLRPVKWILTGSAQMGDWIGRKHMDMFVFDLPLFSSNEVELLINKIYKRVDKSRILDAVADIANEKLVDWLMKSFAGVPGYVIEFAIAVLKDMPIKIYAAQLKS